MSKKDFTFTVTEHIAEISGKGRSRSLQLNKVKWGENEPKFDLRVWRGDTPEKGVTLSDDEMDNLIEVVNQLQY